MVQQTAINITSQYQGNVIVPIGQLPYSTTYLADGATFYSFNARSRRPLAANFQYTINNVNQSLPLTGLYASMPSQTIENKFSYNSGLPRFTLGANTMMRTVDNRLFGYGESGTPTPRAAYWTMCPTNGTQTTAPNTNPFPVLVGTFGLGDIGFLCDNTLIPQYGNPPVPVYQKNVFGSTFTFSPFNETIYPNGEIKNRWGFFNVGCLSPYNIGGQMAGTPSAMNADGVCDYAVMGTTGANSLILIVQNNLTEHLTGLPQVNYYNVTLDDPILAGRTVAQLPTLMPTASGWLMVIDVTAANAPIYNRGTNYQWIVVYYSMDMTQYWTMQFSPNNSVVNTCLGRNIFGGTPWSVFADIDGFFYVSNNAQDLSIAGGQTLMSGRNKQVVTIPGFDPSIAWNFNPPESTFTLPCFDPCSWGEI